MQANTNNPSSPNGRIQSGMSSFKAALTSLNKVPQDARFINCITYLNLNENELTSENLKGLHQLRHLKKLYLCSNEITEINPVWFENMYFLDTLWLHSNAITSAGFATGWAEKLSRLCDLNLANNRIDAISWPDIRPMSKRLRVLNLAYNDVKAFEDVLDLQRLKVLNDLSFADPDYGENPLCRVCNYSEAVLHFFGGQVEVVLVFSIAVLARCFAGLALDG